MATSPSSAENVLAVFVVSSLSLTGLLLYALVIAAMRLNRADFSRSYYTLVLCLAAADCTALFLYVSYFSLSVLTQTYPLGSLVDKLVGTLFGFSFFIGVLFIFNITVNRYYAVCQFAIYEQVYSAENVNRIIAVCAALSALVVAPTVFPCCRNSLHFESYHWNFDQLASPGVVVMIVVCQATNMGYAATMVYCYYRILAVYRASQRQTAPARAVATSSNVSAANLELRLAIQFVGVALILTVYTFVYTLLNLVSTDRWQLFLISLVGVLNHSANPVIYVAASASFRRKFVSMIRSMMSKSPQPSTTSVLQPRIPAATVQKVSHVGARLSKTGELIRQI